MLRFLPILLLACLSAHGASPYFLEELAQKKLETEAAFKEVCEDQDGSWRYLRIDTDPIDIDISSLKNPSLIILPGKRSVPKINIEISGLDGSKERYIRACSDLSLNEIEPVQIAAKHRKYQTIRLTSKRHTHQVWLGEADVIQQLWTETLKPDALFYNQNWAPTLNQQGYSPNEVYNELALMRSREFPTTAQAMALHYAKACVPAIRTRAEAEAKKITHWQQVELLRKAYHQSCLIQSLTEDIARIEPEALQLALVDMHEKFPTRGLLEEYTATAQQVTARKAEALEQLNTAQPGAEDFATALIADCREMLLANPLLDDMQLLAIRRGIGHLNLRDHGLRQADPTRESSRSFGSAGRRLGIPSLSTHTILTTLDRSSNDWNCDIVKLSNLRGEVSVDPLYTAPTPDQLISNARLHWDGNRVAFTMGSKKSEMSLFELDVATGQTKQLSPTDSLDQYVDSCYLPDGNLVVMSTAIMTALACEGGSHLLSNMYLLNPESGKIRQLGVDQENSYHATVTEDGKIMYVRYEYTDTAHYFTRIVMTMNPDGTNQREAYGSNSVWPTSIFYPQPIPGSANLFSAVVSGHHGDSHMGQLVLFDTSKGRREAEGAVQFIGDKDKPIKAEMIDRLYDGQYPKHMYSVPLDAEYYLSMMKTSYDAPWALYLVDRFDNKTEIYQPDEHFIAWPQVLKQKPIPPVIPSHVREDSKTSTLYIQDIYQGPGLANMPHGSVKELAIYAFHYGYRSAAKHSYIGTEGPWDARYLLGTVPVNEDGSVIFNVPAMMPISLSPLDKNGAAMQKMRSWINPQPGEVLSCVGCHETADHAPVNKPTIASRMAPSQIQPWYGEARPYSYAMEVQPVLDQYCIACHDGETKHDGHLLTDLSNDLSKDDLLKASKLSQSYNHLQKFVRRQGPEGDYQLPVPTEWHVTSSSLIQKLKKGHHGVELDEESWRRLYMWIDLNVPFHAAFTPPSYGAYGDQTKWRVESLKEYAGLEWDPEGEYLQLVESFTEQDIIVPQLPKATPTQLSKPQLTDWPFDDAQTRQLKKGTPHTMTLEYGETGRRILSYDNNRSFKKTLNEKERIEFVRIPAGSYVMGDDDNYPNETPRIVTIERPFWMSTTEITNSQLQTIDPTHDSRFADLPEKDQTTRGMPLYNETQPAVRVSHSKALAFCEQLSALTGKKVSLPTEEQWEWAARAGTDQDMWYGNRDTNFAKWANLSDASHRQACTRRKAKVYFNYVASINDKHPATAPVKSFKPNPWGLYDMIGNAEEWTSTSDENGNVIVKGGSWFDMPRDATSATRWGYEPHIQLPDLGFRIIIEE